MRSICFLTMLVVLFSCKNDARQINVKEHKAEIIKTELDFAKMAKDSGISKAFAFFAAEDAVIYRGGDSVLKGREAIMDFYQSWSGQNISLTWSPDFVDISSSGDLGYTYGKYTFIATDSLGKQNSRNGIFHTIWKKQDNGTWRFVWD